MRAVRVLRAGSWDAAREKDRVLLDFDLRHRRRILLRTEAGAELLLDLGEATRLRDGDGLFCGDGSVVRVCARPERLLELTAKDAADLARIAWHLGNRHLPVEVLKGALRIREDPVIAEMVGKLGGEVLPIEAPFEPEPGAYAGPGTHHDHGDQQQ
jgi:urease accessory protein